MSGQKFIVITDQEQEIERVQTGLRMEKRLLKVLRAAADYKDLPLGALLENIVLFSFGDAPSPFSQTDLERVRQLKNVYYDEGPHGGSPEIHLFSHVVRTAVKEGVRDVQLEPQEDGFIHVIHHLGGEMKDQLRVPSENVLEPLIKYIKAMADMSVNKNNDPEEGLLHAQMADGSNFKIHIGLNATQFGQKVTLHLERL